jgi:hypothetical protein
MPLVCNFVQKEYILETTPWSQNEEGGTIFSQGLDTESRDLRMGPTLKFFQTVSVCTEICHGYTIGMP